MGHVSELIACCRVDVHRRAAFWHLSDRSAVVCARCDKIDERIEHRQLAKYVTDKDALESIERLIANVEAKKSSLHPKPEE